MNNARMLSNTARPRAKRKPPALPALLQEIADATDVETALAVAKARGGGRAYFTQNPGADNWLSKLVGPRKARIIGEAVASAAMGVELEVPIGPANANARRLLIETAITDGLSNGTTIAAVALKIGLHRRTVGKHVRRMREEGLLPWPQEGVRRND